MERYSNVPADKITGTQKQAKKGVRAKLLEGGPGKKAEIDGQVYIIVNDADVHEHLPPGAEISISTQEGGEASYEGYYDQHGKLISM